MYFSLIQKEEVSNFRRAFKGEEPDHKFYAVGLNSTSEEDLRSAIVDHLLTNPDFTQEERQAIVSDTLAGILDILYQSVPNIKAVTHRTYQPNDDCIMIGR